MRCGCRGVELPIFGQEVGCGEQGEMTTGIIGYGAYVPHWRIKGADIAAAWSTDWEKIAASLAVHEKSVPAIDEDTTTIAVAAAANALARAGVAADTINAIFVGSESHAYAVKPTATMVAHVLGLNKFSHAADLEFACKAGTAALITACSLVGAGMATHALAIGADTAQAAPGDVLEYTAAAGGAAFIVAADAEAALATIEHTCSMTTDTPDFWRRPHEIYPEHTGRFTAQPAYFYHTIAVAQELLRRVGLQPSDINHVVFHQPNGRFPVTAAKQLGFTADAVALGLLAPQIGNTYSAATLLGLTAVLDQALPDQRILVVGYGSGSGADVLLLRTTKQLAVRRAQASATADYLECKAYVSYQTYRRIMEVVHGV
jgi:hydroxymethylglutaryl-CoA synthase